MFRRVLVVVLLVIAAASAAWAQRFRVMEGPGMPLHMPPPHFSDGAFTICKMMFTSNRREANGFGWSTDYPFAGLNLMLRSSELTKTRISKDTHGDARYWTVHLTDDALFDCPFLVGSDVGTIGLAPTEIKRLRDYLLKGGFLWVDDFWGEYAWQIWETELRKALPSGAFPMIDLPVTHPLFHVLYDVKGVAQIPSINVWLGTGQTSERVDSQVPHARAILDDKQHVLVLITHNTDYSDAFEREGENHAYFERFAGVGYAFGINALLYALSH
jgi:hypothetical protein